MPSLPTRMSTILRVKSQLVGPDRHIFPPEKKLFEISLVSFHLTAKGDGQTSCSSTQIDVSVQQCYFPGLTFSFSATAVLLCNGVNILFQVNILSQ